MNRRSESGRYIGWYLDGEPIKDYAGMERYGTSLNAVASTKILRDLWTMKKVLSPFSRSSSGRYDVGGQFWPNVFIQDVFFNLSLNHAMSQYLRRQTYKGIYIRPSEERNETKL